ncbi:hypothetical protein E6O51_20310 [Pseudothauera rhizosphaerae]|uniref:TrfB transcriptional repressor protein domain-containing protein n=1 Tax=Pseudothauera rhizosphaerae TaxID=2565932 RepID=A0A4S4AAM3_9RHOO|nr:hypothetical protein E6O51_20310 [Pseudothauera rhizosphaerae]
MTPDAFAALCALHRTRSPAAQEAARLVMVEGLSQTKAAARVGVSSGSVSNAVATLRARLALARRAAGVE